MNTPRFRNLELKVKKLINNFGSGNHVSPLKDSIIDVDGVHEYQSGDKKLDSKSSLRTSQIMSRVFIPDKALNILLILDISNSQFSKLEASIFSCLYLSHLAEMSNDRVGLITFGSKVSNHLEPSDDTRGICGTLEKIYLQKNLESGTDLDEVLLRVGNLGVNNTLVVLISDFCFDFTDKTIGLCRRIAGGVNNTLLALIPYDHVEWDFSLPFNIDFMDAELNLGGNANNGADFSDWKKQLTTNLRRGRFDPVFMDVQADYMMALVKYFLKV